MEYGNSNRSEYDLKLLLKLRKIFIILKIYRFENSF